MTPEIAKAAMQFMMRVQLTGQEVPAFNEVMRTLDAVALPRPHSQPAQDDPSVQ
jgi:hypothetical protein